MPSVTVIGVKEVNKRLSNLRAYAVRAESLPVPTLVSKQAINAAKKLAQEFYHSPANPPRYPLRWKSQKQRRYVMAKLRREGNLPYRRTGGYDNAWESETGINSISIMNTATGDKGQFIAPFLIGTFQQPFHADTGYQKRSAQLEKQIIAPIVTDIKRQAFQGIASSRYG